jgi:hypothetical protein
MSVIRGSFLGAFLFGFARVDGELENVRVVVREVCRREADVEVEARDERVVWRRGVRRR